MISVATIPLHHTNSNWLQRVFESHSQGWRNSLHLSRGERSILDAFHSAGQALADSEVGVLIPLYRFYPSIDSFLDTADQNELSTSQRQCQPKAVRH